MRVQEIMTTEVETVSPDTPFKDLIDRLVRLEVSGLPVVDPSGKLVGIVTEADVISKEAYGTRRRRALSLLHDVLAGRDHRWVTKAVGSVAADVMTKEVVVCTPRDDVRTVAKRMLERRVKRVPVVESGLVVGMISRHDILSTFARPDALVRADVERALSEDPNRPDDFHVSVSVEGGIVTLTGDVRYAWDEPSVLSIAREVAGVIDVVGRLHHREQQPRAPGEPWIFSPR